MGNRSSLGTLRLASHKAPARALGIPLTDEEQQLLRDKIAKHGIPAVAAFLKMPDQTVARAASGAGLREGTRIQLRGELPGLRDAC